MTVHGVVAGASERLPTMAITYRIKGEGIPPHLQWIRQIWLPDNQQLCITETFADL